MYDPDWSKLDEVGTCFVQSPLYTPKHFVLSAALYAVLSVASGGCVSNMADPQQLVLCIGMPLISLL